MALTQNIHIFKNFVTDAECNLLSDWILKNYQTEVFQTPSHPGTVRRSTRFSLKPIEYPILSYNIQQKLDKKLMEIFESRKIVKVPDFFNGMYASYCFIGDECGVHKDPVYIKNTITYHCNLYLTNHEGGQLILDDEECLLKKGDIICYPVSSIPHGTTKLIGETPRMFWNFGYCVYEQ